MDLLSNIQDVDQQTPELYNQHLEQKTKFDQLPNTKSVIEKQKHLLWTQRKDPGSC